jgi:hypothetical protein
MQLSWVGCIFEVKGTKKHTRIPDRDFANLEARSRAKIFLIYFSNGIRYKSFIGEIFFLFLPTNRCMVYFSEAFICKSETAAEGVNYFSDRKHQL